jgi:hypothetical protein
MFDVTFLTDCRVKQYTMTLTIVEACSQSHLMICQTISLSTSTTSSTLYQINGCTIGILMTENVEDITILRSIFWNKNKDIVNVISWHATTQRGNNYFMIGLKSDKKRWTSSITMQWSFCKWFNVCVNWMNCGVVTYSTNTKIIVRGSSNVIVSTPKVVEWCKPSHHASTSCPLTSMDKGTTIITMWLVIVGGIVSVMDLPCLMGMTTNKLVWFSNTNVTTRPCSFEIHYWWPNCWKACKAHTSCVRSLGSGRVVDWLVFGVDDVMIIAMRDAKLGCTAPWSYICSTIGGWELVLVAFFVGK